MIEPSAIPPGRGGRPLAVLFIGNIANNAFYLARLLRKAGVEADVLCHDDYWTMSSPEWEEAEFDEPPTDMFRPDWWSIDLHGYQRPRWFAQGPFPLAVEYLRAWRGEADSESAWSQLEAGRKEACLGRSLPPSFYVRTRQASFQVPGIGGLLRWIAPRARRTWFSLRGDPFVARSRELAQEFARRFPDRPDRLQVLDVLHHRSTVERLRPLFRHYDLVQGFSVDPQLPMLAGVRPYLAFEHGTLRDSPEATWDYTGPFQNAPKARGVALSYALADWVFITNADCLSSAHRLGIQRYTPTPHPYDEQGATVTQAEISALRQRYEGLAVFFCPIRHDWVDKGTDRYLNALPALRDRLGGRVKVLFTPWGREVERSRRLIGKLGCSSIVDWVGPFGRLNLVRWMTAADAVFDQLAYPSLSGISSKALACGVPVVGAYDHAVLGWMFPEPAPILRATGPSEIVEHALNSTRPAFREEYSRKARAWFREWHSGERVTRLFLDAYRQVLASPPVVRGVATG